MAPKDSDPSSSFPVLTLTLPATAISVVVARPHNSQQHVKFAVAALVPRKRTSWDDPIKHTLQHWIFMDDKRSFSHFDALLTRLAPLSIIHLGCTEKAEAPKGRKNEVSSSAAERKANQVKNLLEKITVLISSRNDLVAENDESGELTQAHPSLPSIDLDSCVQHLLVETSFLQYRNMVLEDILQKALQLLLQGQGMSAKTDSTNGTCELAPGVLTSHMLLDRTASECIHLLPPAHAGIASVVGGKTHNNSLFGILNQCKTAVGSRTLQCWLRQPLVQLEPLQQRQDAVAALVDDSIGRDRLRDEGLAALTCVDLDKLAMQLSNYSETFVGSTSAALECLYKVYMLITQRLPQLCEALHAIVAEEESGLLKESYDGLVKVLEDMVRCCELAETVLDLDQAPREFMVKCDFNEELQEIRKELDQTESELDSCRQQMNEEWSDVSGQPIGQVRLELFGETEWQFRLPKTNDAKVLQAQTGVTVHRLLKNGVYFSTKELRQVSRKKQDLLKEYDSHQRQIVVDASKIASSYAPVVERASALVADTDVLASLAHVAAYNPNGYCKPELTDGEDDGMGIELKEARHPCVELQESISYIPNDISLVFGNSSFLIVTGPNMGGKSTYIRALGAIVTLAQIGSYVPCTSAKINLVHHILARVGAGDSQDRGISTFMAEMLEASSILSKATKRSLIIIDELGRGTSTYDGYGLAAAISEYIIQRIGCVTVFTTHFHELTALAQEHPSVKNCHVTAQAGEHDLAFMYNVQPGPCLESFGIQVAEMAQVPGSVVADAKHRARQLEKFDCRQKKRKAPDSERVANRFLAKFRQLPWRNYQTDEEKRLATIELLNEYKSASM